MNWKLQRKPRRAGIACSPFQQGWIRWPLTEFSSRVSCDVLGLPGYLMLKAHGPSTELAPFLTYCFSVFPSLLDFSLCSLLIPWSSLQPHSGCVCSLLLLISVFPREALTVFQPIWYTFDFRKIRCSLLGCYWILYLYFYNNDILCLQAFLYLSICSEFLWCSLASFIFLSITL